MSIIREGKAKDKPAPDTALYVDMCAKKWKPLTEGMSEKKKARAAFVMEQEARYLNDLSDGDRSAAIGNTLKFIFPILKSCVVGLSEFETDYPKVYEAMRLAIKSVAEAVAEIRPSDAGLTLFEQNSMLELLTSRVHLSLLRHERIYDQIGVKKWQPMLDANKIEGDELRRKVARMLEQVASVYTESIKDRVISAVMTE